MYFHYRMAHFKGLCHQKGKWQPKGWEWDQIRSKTQQGQPLNQIAAYAHCSLGLTLTAPCIAFTEFFAAAPNLVHNVQPSGPYSKILCLWYIMTWWMSKVSSSLPCHLPPRLSLSWTDTIHFPLLSSAYAPYSYIPGNTNSLLQLRVHAHSFMFCPLKSQYREYKPDTHCLPFRPFFKISAKV